MARGMPMAKEPAASARSGQWAGAEQKPIAIGELRYNPDNPRIRYLLGPVHSDCPPRSGPQWSTELPRIQGCFPCFAAPPSWRCNILAARADHPPARARGSASSSQRGIFTKSSRHVQRSVARPLSTGARTRNGVGKMETTFSESGSGLTRYFSGLRNRPLLSREQEGIPG